MEVVAWPLQFSSAPVNKKPEALNLKLQSIVFLL